jgi:hypothetical protein
MKRALIAMWLKFYFYPLFIMLLAPYAYAQKISVGFGGYYINAQVGKNETSLTNLGAYKMQYHSKIQEHFEILVAYNIIIEDIIVGDKAFGPFLGLSYYPFGSQTSAHATYGPFSISQIKNWNPYVFGGFNQRQYQSIKSNYSGFSFGAGTELGFSRHISLFSEAQLALLEGPNEGSMQEMQIIVGMNYHY